MDTGQFHEKIISRVEVVTITALQILVILLVCVATIILFVLFANHVRTDAFHIASIPDLLDTMQTSFSGILIVVLGLELLETLKTYFVEHHIRVEVILVVAIIAVGRHVIQTDFEHTPGLVLLGFAAVIFALTLGYYLVKKSHD